MIVSASGDKTVKVWSLATKTCIATLQGHNEAIVKVNWLNAGLQVVSASVDGIVKVWNIKKQLCQNTFEMHEDKIWALDFAEQLRDGVPKLALLTGGADAKVKLWIDSTVEEKQKENAAEMERISQEHQLSRYLREEELVEASLLAFKMNKLRDFFYALTKLVCARAMPPKPFLPGMPGKPPSEARLDPVDSILMSQQQFKQVLETGKAVTEPQDNQGKLQKIVKTLLEEDKKKFLETIKKLNARQEYAYLAQILLSEISPQLDIDDLLEKDFKDNFKSLKDLLAVTCLYSDKHYQRAQRNFKQSFFVDYILSRMTLQSESFKQEESKVERKRDLKAKRKL